MMAIIKSFDGSQIYYEDSGNGDYTLVFVHGGGINLESWQYQRELNESYRCIFIDLPGHGKSSSSRDKYSMESFGRDIVGVIESLKLNNVIVIGHSMGGAITIEAAIQLKNKPIGIIIADSLFPNPNGFYPQKTELEIENFIRNKMIDPHQFLFDLYENYVTKRVDFNSKDKELLLMARDSTNIVIFQSLIEELMKWDLFAKLKQISVPIRCIVAGVSVPPNSAERNIYTQYFSTVFIENTAHFLQLENPIEFNKLLNMKIKEIISESL